MKKKITTILHFTEKICCLNEHTIGDFDSLHHNLSGIVRSKECNYITNVLYDTGRNWSIHVTLQLTELFAVVKMSTVNVRDCHW